jgi:hypothetical protein
VNQQGTEITQSGEGDLLCASAVPLRLTVVLTQSQYGSGLVRLDMISGGGNDIEYIVEEWFVFEWTCVYEGKTCDWKNKVYFTGITEKHSKQLLGSEGLLFQFTSILLVIQVDQNSAIIRPCDLEGERLQILLRQRNEVKTCKRTQALTERILIMQYLRQSTKPCI